MRTLHSLINKATIYFTIVSFMALMCGGMSFAQSNGNGERLSENSSKTMSPGWLNADLYKTYRIKEVKEGGRPIKDPRKLTAVCVIKVLEDWATNCITLCCAFCGYALRNNLFLMSTIQFRATMRSSESGMRASSKSLTLPSTIHTISPGCRETW